MIPAQSVRRSSSRSTAWRGTPSQTSSAIAGVSTTFSQKTHCQWPVSE